MATTEHSATAQGSLQELAKRHLWMHFTRHGRLRRPRRADHRPRRGLPRLRRARQPLLRRPVRAVLREHRPRPRRRRPGRRRPGPRAGLLHQLVLRAPARDRARRAHRRRWRPATSTASSSPAAAARRSSPRSSSSRQYHKLTGNPNKTKVDRARDRLPRDHARRAERHRHHRRCARRSSRSRPAAATCPNTNLYRMPDGHDARRTSPRRSPTGSSSRAPRRWPP